MGNPPQKKYPIGGGILSPARRLRSRIFAAAFRAPRAAQKNSQCRRQTVRRGKNLWKAKRAFPAAIMLPSGAGARLFIDACRADFDNICAQNIRPSRAIRERKTVCGEQTGGKIEKKRADWKIKWFSATQHARGRKFQRRRAKKFPKRESASNRGLAPSCARRGRKKSGLRQPANPLFRDISAISRRLCSARASLWSRASRGR